MKIYRVLCIIEWLIFYCWRCGNGLSCRLSIVADGPVVAGAVVVGVVVAGAVVFGTAVAGTAAFLLDGSV